MPVLINLSLVLADYVPTIGYYFIPLLDGPEIPYRREYEPSENQGYD